LTPEEQDNQCRTRPGWKLVHVRISKQKAVKNGVLRRLAFASERLKARTSYSGDEVFFGPSSETEKLSAY
jgi:hypothetical protein